MAIKEYEPVFKAAADPVRARILKMLEGRELCVCQIIEVLRLSQSTVSEHLSILKEASLVTGRRDGRWVHYSLSDRKKNKYALPMLALILGWLDDDPKIRADRRCLASLGEKSVAECD